MNRVFFIAGRTGGPFFPLPAVANGLKNIEPICIGIKGGFEDTASRSRGWKIYYLPDTRLTLLSFKTEKLRETIKNYFNLLKNIIFLGWSFCKSFYLLISLKPKLIYSTGSFLAVPMIFASRITNILNLTNTKIVIHQQDPLPGLSNKLTANYANLISCVFDYTKSNFNQFHSAQLIPNPIDTAKYDYLDNQNISKNKILTEFLAVESKLPLLLIFGGGSGSEDINIWSIKNIDSLLQKFRVIHLTGILQTKKLKQIGNPDYLRLQALYEEMPIVIYKADLVLCRAGMASITELLYMEKPAYLVPLPSTHQEKNAEMVRDYFYILHQKDRPEWIETIDKSYPKSFKIIRYPDQAKNTKLLEKYYQSIQELLD